MKVQIKATRRNPHGEVIKLYNINTRIEDEAKDAAELKFLNEYINRDCKIIEFTNVKQAKEFLNKQTKGSKMKIESVIIKKND